MSRPYRLAWSKRKSKRNPKGYWKLGKNPSYKQPVPDGYWDVLKKSGQEHARLSDVLKALQDAGIPADKIFVKPPFPPELGELFDGLQSKPKVAYEPSPLAQALIASTWANVGRKKRKRAGKALGKDLNSQDGR